MEQKTISKPILIQTNAAKKLNEPWLKQFFRSFVAGIFIGLAYIATLIISASVSNTDNMYRLLQWAGSLIFGIGVISCCVFGGSLFTGNCSGFLPCMNKITKWRLLAKNLAITFVGNYLGTIFMAVLVTFTPTFNQVQNHFVAATNLSIKIVDLAIKKFETPWWQALLSAIACNIAVSLAVFSWTSIDNKAASCIVIILMISVFVIAGYEHVVALMFLTTIAGFTSCLPVVSTIAYSAEEMKSFAGYMGRFFYNWLIPCTIGNALGGFFISVLYYYANEYIEKKKKTK